MLINRRLLQRGVPLRSIQAQCSLLASADDQLHALIAVSRDLVVQVLALQPSCLRRVGLCARGLGKTSCCLVRRRLFQRLLSASLELRSEIQVIAIDRESSMVQVALNRCSSHGTTTISGLQTLEQAMYVASRFLDLVIL